MDKKIQFSYDCCFNHLEKHIQDNYKNSELIDFEGEQRKLIMMQNHGLRDQLIAENRRRHWEFLAKDVILRISKTPNRP